MKKTKAGFLFLGNFLLGALGVTGIGWILLLAFPKAAKAVYIVGGVLILMCLWTAYDEMRKKLITPSGSAADTQPEKSEPEENAK